MLEIISHVYLYLDIMNTHDDILNLLIASLEEAIEHRRKLQPDLPIQDHFDDVFNQYKLIVGPFIFELEAEYEIPEDLDDYSLTFREFASKVAEHPKEVWDYRKHW